MMLRLEDLLLDAVDEVVRNVFDDETATIILGYLKDNSSKMLDERVRIFSQSLPRILGIGSVIIEDLVLETMYSKLGLEFEPKRDCDFEKYVLELKHRIRSE